MDSKVKYIIDYGVEKYYSRYDCLHYHPLDYWKEYTYNDEKIKNIQPSTPLPDIARIVADKFNKIIEETKKIEKEPENKVEPQIQEMFKEDNKTTMTKEKPKINTISKKNNKGVAVILSIITGILVVIGMILVTLISYTIIK